MLFPPASSVLCCLDLQAVVREKEGLSSEHEHLKRRTETIMANYEQEKQVSIHVFGINAFLYMLFTLSLQETFSAKVSMTENSEYMCYF